MRRVYLCPSLNDGEDFRGREVCECEVVRRREGYYVAFSCYGCGAQEEVGEVWKEKSQYNAMGYREGMGPLGSASGLYSACSSFTAL